MSAPGAGPRHQTTLTVLMTPDMANFSGNVHGGAILKLLDQVAFTWASRFAQTCGARVVVHAVPTENIPEQPIRHTNSCYFTMVAIDEERRPVPVPRLECTTD